MSLIDPVPQQPLPDNASNAKGTLTEPQQLLLSFVEQEWGLTGLYPSEEAVVVRLGEGARTTYRSSVKSAAFKAACTRRGIVMPNTSTAHLAGVLSPEQLSVVNTLLDPTDTRSDKKKLADMGIVGAKFSNWLADPVFAKYYKDRVSTTFKNFTAEAKRAHMDKAKSGDMKAIEMLYEMNGEWSSKTVGELNVDFVLARVIEAVQRHVSQLPGGIDAIIAIANEVAELSPRKHANAAVNAPTLPLLAAVTRPALTQPQILEGETVTSL